MKTRLTRFTLLIMLMYLTCINLHAQPQNDKCSGALDFGNITSFDNGDFCAGADWYSFPVDLAGANPEPNLEVCQLDQFPVVWFSFTPQMNTDILTIQVYGPAQAAPSLSVFKGNCSNLTDVALCQTGKNGILRFLSEEFIPGNTYYLALGDANQTTDSLTIYILASQYGSQCITSTEFLPVYRSGEGPEDGPYLPGDTVGFRFSVNNFLVSTGIQNCQWFQGVIPVFGEGWSSASFDTSGMPLHATMNGNAYPVPGVHNSSVWDWYDDVTYHHPHCLLGSGDFDANGTLDLCNKLTDPFCSNSWDTGGCCGPCWTNTPGNAMPPGWFAAGVTGLCQVDDHPNVDWGDGNTCQGPTGPWNFYFELIVSEEACFSDRPEAFAITMHTFADGETGSWNGGPSVCGQDRPIKYYAEVECCLTGTERSILSGRLFADLEGDCLYNGDEPILSFIPVLVRNASTGETFNILTNSAGRYIISLYPGNYWLVPQLDTLQLQACPDSVLVEIDSYCETYDQHLAIDDPDLCLEDLELYLNYSTLRPCINSQLTINLRNAGGVALNDVELILDLDSLQVLGSVNIPFEDLGNNTFKLNINHLPAGQWMTVTAFVTTSCEAPIGYKHCSSVRLATPLCNGKELHTERCRHNVVAIDPNNKVDLLESAFEPTYIDDGETIRYQINFQNTGTAPAIRVTVLDTLSPELDPLSFRFVGSSHNVEIALEQNNILRFFFDEIHLPDSTANEAASHGFVTFELTPFEGLDVEHIIPNRSAIYFDFNEPVITNEKHHIIGCGPENTFQVFLEETLCPGDSLLFHGIVLNEDNQEVTVVVQDTSEGGCDTVYFANIDFYPPIQFQNIIISIDHGQSDGGIELQPFSGTAYTFLWSNGNTSNAITNVEAGEYSVTVTDEFGCASVFMYTVPLNTAVSPVPADRVIHIFPVPAGDMIHLEVPPNLSINNIRLYSITGIELPVITTGQDQVYDIGQLSQGLYLLHMQTDRGIVIRKFVKGR